MQKHLEFDADHQSTPWDGDFSPPNATARDIDLLKLAVRKKWLMIAGAVVGLVVGQLCYLKFGPSYIAVGRILVSKKAEIPIKDGVVQSFGERGEHVTLMMSPIIVSRAVEKHGLNKLATLAAKENPTDAIIGSLKVKRSAGQDQSFLNVLDISYSNSSESDAKAVVTAVIDSYRDYLADSEKEHTARMRQSARETSESLTQQLRAKEQEHLDFRKHIPLLWRNAPGTEEGQIDVTDVHRERLLAIEAEVQSNLLKRARIRSRIKSLETARDRGESNEALEGMVRLFARTDSGPSDARRTTSPEQAQLDQQLLPLLLEGNKLRRSFGDDHPDVQAVRRNIKTLIDFYRHKGVRLPEQALAGATASVDFVGVYLRSQRQMLAEFDQRDVELGALFENETKLAKSYDRDLLQDRALHDELQRIKDRLRMVSEGMSLLDFTRHSFGYQVTQIAPAQAGLVIKRHFAFLGGGLVFGVLSTLGIAFLRAQRDTTVRSVAEIRDSLGWPVLGVIPEFKPAAVDATSSSAIAMLSPDVRYIHDPDSAEAEAFRSARAALFGCAQSQQAKLIQITSPGPRDGKTTLAGNLAAAMAQSGRTVLLMDADLRRPCVHSLFGVKGDVGMSDVLSGEIELLNAVEPAGIEGLFVLAAGPSLMHPSEQLSSKAFRQLLDAARRHFDFVLIDTPPLLTVSDPCVVAPQIDGVLLVLRIGKIDRSTAQRAAHLLETNAANVLGIVANGTVEGGESDFSGGVGTAFWKPHSSEESSIEPDEVPVTV